MRSSVLQGLLHLVSMIRALVDNLPMCIVQVHWPKLCLGRVYHWQFAMIVSAGLQRSYRELAMERELTGGALELSCTTC